MRITYPKLFLFLLLAGAFFNAHAVTQSEVKGILKELNRTIEERDKYQKEKQWRISNLRNELADAKTESDEFNICSQLFNEYKCYQYDSAYHYARKLDGLSSKSGEKAEVAKAKIALLFCFKSVGFFNEAMETIRSFRTDGVSDGELAEFYLLCAETYQNLSSYVNVSSDLSSIYDKKKMEYYDLAFAHTSPGSYLRSYIALEIGLIRNYSDSLAIEGRKRLISGFNLDEHEKAVQYSILAAAFNSLDRTDNAVYYRALSAINDIRSCTHETTSAKVLAEYMYDRHDIALAHIYIQQALYDADFYDSQLRRVEINSILPLIENSRYKWINSQRVLFLVIGVTILALLILTFSLFAKLRKRNKVLAETHSKLVAGTEVLNRANATLSKLNGKLKETNEIKDQYIIQSLYGNSSFVNEVEEQLQLAIRNITARQYDDAKTLLYHLGIKKERERIYASFDMAFMKLFPNFIEDFNALFPEDAWIQLDANGALPMEVRIFALMRLGIDNPAQVAEYLNISVNTIYVYKTKVKSRSLVPKDSFDSRIMAIPKP
ncbi:MAG: DUF6377 domain-containing protein [Bacteroidales bacterium]|jgi:hypothetical protein|nr:DUF6377 domain-containing protein [Bacteroidales bacterium]MCI2122468.1 DUF6377 domain-containing protein [Bacteroidales bacterium]MCI2144833.1 DUF6377 domain-containing protein [Bacteroidales bacterium]